MRQVIIVRKDLNMQPGKLAAQVAHAAMAFISHKICNSPGQYMPQTGLWHTYDVTVSIDLSEWDYWWHGSFTKTVCEAKNYNKLMKAVTIAEELGLKEGEDFFLIKDACLTDLTPEEIDENGQGRTLTCIGFRPLDDETAWKISKEFQLYH